MTSDFCMPQLAQRTWKAWPLEGKRKITSGIRAFRTANQTQGEDEKEPQGKDKRGKGPSLVGCSCSLRLPDHGVGRGVDADAVVEVEVRDDAAPGAAGLVDAVAGEDDLVVEVPPAAAGVEGRGGGVGEGRDGGEDEVFG